MPRLDFNLLRTFIVLWDEQSVSRAAAKVNITQSAMSHALKRLRLMLNDDLFERTSQGLVPTAFSVNLEPRLRIALRQVELAVELDDFDPRLSRRMFVIATGAYNCEVTIPGILAAAKRQAPCVKFKIVPLGQQLTSHIESGAVDVAIGSFENWPATIQGATLYREDMVWAAKRDHSRDLSSSDEVLRSQSRVEVSTTELKPYQLSRDAVQPRTTLRPYDGGAADSPPMVPARPADLIVYDNRTALDILSRTDMVAILPRRVVERHAVRYGVTIIETQSIPASASVSMIWSRQQAATDGHDWLRALISRHALASSESVPDLDRSQPAV